MPGKTPAGVALVKGDTAGIRSQGDGASAGPTGAAWVDSNGWRIRLSRMQSPDKQVWIETDPPKSSDVIPTERYLVGIADAGAHGGKWVVSLDPTLRKAVATKKPDAIAEWKRIATAARFFNAHTDWAALPARSMLGVLSDFRGDNEFLSTEILNLAARQQIAYRLVDKTTFTGLPTGLKAIVYTDQQAPATQIREALNGFVESGGLLITVPAWGKVAGDPLPDSPTVRFTLHPAGKGRIALGNDVSDPYLVAKDAQILLSHRFDPIRIWNPGSVGTYVTGGDSRSVVHLINYSGRASREAMSIKVMGSFSKAVLHGFDGKGPAELKILQQKDGVELHLPPVAVYAAVECS